MKQHYLLLFLFFAPWLSAQESLFHCPLIKDSVVVGGLQYRYYQRDTSGPHPLSIQVLEVDLDRVVLQLQLAMDQIIGQETVSSMVGRTGALAGINGGFSFSNNPWNIRHGDPKDLLIRDGHILSEPHLTRASFGWTTKQGRQRPLIEQFQWKGYAVMDHKDSLRLSGVNRGLQAENDLILYTSEWNATTLSPAGTLEVMVDDEGKRIASNRQGSNAIPAGGFVLSGRVEKLLQSDNISIDHTLISLLSGKPVDYPNGNFHTAGPMLMRAGKRIQHQQEEQIPEAFVSTAHPRTAVGFDRAGNTLYLVVVDGRQPGRSLGISLPDLSLLLQELGAWEAYNLDGGGSTTMVIGDRVMNSPSDPQERRRCDALLLFPMRN